MGLPSYLLSLFVISHLSSPLMALLFPPPPALSSKPPFPAALRPTRPPHLSYATASNGSGVSFASPSTSSPDKAPALDGADGKRRTKKRRTLKPRLEKQALRDWPARAPSQRASSARQRQQQQPRGEDEGARDQEPGRNCSATLRSIVEYFDFDYDSSDGDGGAGAGGGGGADDDVVVRDEVAKEDRDEGRHPQPSFLLGSQPVSAPWMHGEEPIKNQLVSDEEGADRDDAFNDELGLVDGQEVDLGSDEEIVSEISEGEFSDDRAAPATNSSSVMDSVVDRGFRGGGFDRGIRRCSVRSIVNTMRNSMEKSSRNVAIEWPESEDFVQKLGPVLLPWERVEDKDAAFSGDRTGNHSNTELAKRIIAEPELQRLRDVALRMKERIRVGPGGVTQVIVDNIHQKWKVDEVVKLWFEGPPNLNMKRTHDILEDRTGGIVIWRSGRSVVLYRGVNYNLQCTDGVNHSGYGVKSSQEPIETFDMDSFLDQLGPRYKDWSGRGPIPVDADLLPGVVPGYKPPFRLLPYKVKNSLTNREITALRRLARQTAPHFALGRNREHQGLATAIVKLWEKSSIANIAIKRGVSNTCNDRMAEELRKLTGGVLFSRNNEYIVFYRGNDFIAPKVRKVLVENQEQAITQQDEEELARLKASALISLVPKALKSRLVAGTLAETREAISQWGDSLNHKLREKEKNHLVLTKHTSLLRNLKRKLILAKTKVTKAEIALAKVQEMLSPAELPTDLETITDEERFLFRRMGLKMKAFLMLGRREVFDGTVQNMHLHWKHRELVKIIVKGKRFAQVKHIAISLEAESEGVLISIDKIINGYAIILYRGKNYKRPQILKPRNLLTRRKALARSIELQRREALNHHISMLRDKIWKLNSRLVDMKDAGEKPDAKLLQTVEDDLSSDDDKIEDEGEEAYLQTYNSDNEEEADDDPKKYL
ncbi:hypothetical protein GUJ93_ZPchr0002g25712 [Zizania palustris]|uniref:CRM-domain containing factor CFM3, chloroplastic/mitochondrial n=1 Tax=Zizania palustris TaxID=103762 RepID=A0A8J5RM76_ZIZPA|nr:hypothetical protein GUJ93_ZPchr0002g25712 [Zizania palustris]